MYRYKFLVSFKGTGFSGSQKQLNATGVFNVIESALEKTFKLKLRCIPAGRTDTGVHARNMVFHVDFNFEIDVLNIVKRLNRYLIRKSIILHTIELVDFNFHALSSAESRTYQYFFTFDDELPHYLLDSVAIIDGSPKFLPTTDALKRIFVGQKNYRFLSNVAESKSTLRMIYDVEFYSRSYSGLFNEQCDIYVVQITANGFLYRMVRHIVGLLLHSMVNFTSLAYVKDYLHIHRVINYSLAPPEGLHLSEINY